MNNSSDGMVFTFGSNSAIKNGGLPEKMRTILCEISNQEIVYVNSFRRCFSGTYNK
jgi:hypothetical protein